MWFLVLLSKTLGFSKSGPRSELWDGVVFAPLSSHLLILGTAFWNHRVRLTCSPGSPHPPLQFELGSVQNHSVFHTCIRMTKKAASVCTKAAIQLFGVPFWCLFGAFLVNNAILENMCFTIVKHTFSLNWPAWMWNFNCYFSTHASELGNFESWFNFWTLWDKIGFQMGAPRVPKNLLKFSHGA